MKTSVDIVTTRSIRTALSTIEHVSHLPPNYPWFVHKWSREKRQYSRKDIDLPAELYIKGLPIDDQKPIIAVAGTRSPSVECFCLVSMITTELAMRNCTILSGGVPGVDLAAHLSALDHKCARTYAVLANPASLGFSGHEWKHKHIEQIMVRQGGFISEYTTTAELFGRDHKERVLERCRIISGLCDVLLVFECSENSATVDTAKRALLQGKRVVAIQADKRTARKGIEQLTDEHDIPVVAPKTSIGQITDKILVTMGGCGEDCIGTQQPEPTETYPFLLIRC